MKLPKSIPIGGHPIRLVKSSALDDFGEYKHDLGQILIGKLALDGTEATLIATIRHEALDAALHIGGQAWAEKYNQESVVRCVEGLFFPAWDAFMAKLTKLNQCQPNTKQ